MGVSRKRISFVTQCPATGVNARFGLSRSYFGLSLKGPVEPSALDPTAASAIGAFFAGFGQAIGPGNQVAQFGIAAGAVGCLAVGLAVGCCCGFGWGLLLGSAAPQATAVASRALARFATQAAFAAAAGGPNPGYALRAVRPRA